MNIKRTKRIIDYMESAQDNTSVYHEIDKWLLDDEINNQPSHSRVKLIEGKGWVRENYNKDGSLNSISSAGEPQPESPNPNYPKKYSLLTDMHEGIQPQLHRQSLSKALSQEPQHSMRAYNQPQWPMPEDILPVGLGLKTSKSLLGLIKGGKGPIGKQASHFRTNLDDYLDNILKKYESRTRGKSIAKTIGKQAGSDVTKEMLETKFIIDKLSGKI